MKASGCTPEIELFGNSDEVARVTKFHSDNGNSYNLSLRLEQNNSERRQPALYLF
jgi:hypothetical protein